MPTRNVSKGRPRRQPRRVRPRAHKEPRINAPAGAKGTSSEPEFPDFPKEVEIRDVSSLTPYAQNARTHSTKQIHHISASMSVFGFNNPILIDADGTIIAGHGRVEAAKLLGWNRVPCIRIEHLTDDQKRAYVIADNRLAELAGWDDELLAIELQHLSEVEIDFDVEITGFETAEIDYRIESLAPDEPDEADDTSELEEDLPNVSQPGDLWQMGPHRLLCGDALDSESYKELLFGETARMVFILPIDGQVCGPGGETSEAEYTAFLTAALANLSANWLIAAEKTGRVGHGVELDPRYVDVAVRRWQRLTGQPAIHAESGETFDDLAKTRARCSSTDAGGQTAEEVSDD